MLPGDNSKSVCKPKKINLVQHTIFPHERVGYGDETIVKLLIVRIDVNNISQLTNQSNSVAANFSTLHAS